MNTDKHVVAPENAEKFKDWFANRGGIAVWHSADLSNPGLSWTTPALTEDGKPYPKSHWQMQSEPSRVITDPSDVVVSFDKEVRRFHVAVRRGSQGLSLKVTDGGFRRIRSAVARAGEGAYYMFDYMTQEAVILKPERQVPLNEWEG